MDGFAGDPERGRGAEGDLDPEKIAHELEEFGRTYAEAYAEAKLLEKQESIVLATLIQQFRDGPPKRTRADAQDLAKMSEEYSVHLEVMIEARRKANIANACWQAARARFEAMRTAEATRRAEMQTFRGNHR